MKNQIYEPAKGNFYIGIDTRQPVSPFQKRLFQNLFEWWRVNMLDRTAPKYSGRHIQIVITPDIKTPIEIRCPGIGTLVSVEYAEEAINIMQSFTNRPDWNKPRPLITNHPFVYLFNRWVKNATWPCGYDREMSVLLARTHFDRRVSLGFNIESHPAIQVDQNLSVAEFYSLSTHSYWVICFNCDPLGPRKRVSATIHQCKSIEEFLFFRHVFPRPLGKNQVMSEPWLLFNRLNKEIITIC